MPSETIFVCPGEPGRVYVRVPYSQERLTAIKSFPDRRWLPAEKMWSLPADPGLLDRLKSVFPGDVIETSAAPAARDPGDPLLRRAAEAMRARHFSPRTEEAYLGWTVRFLAWSKSATPQESDIAPFLSGLAESKVSASTQNQAFNALLFLFKQVLGRDIGLIEGVVRARPSKRLPVVLSKEEVRAVLGVMKGTPKLMAALLYGSGLRLLECCNLRVKDIDFSQNQLVVRAGKGDKDRYTTLPSTLLVPLRKQLDAVHALHQEDLGRGLGRVALPNALSRKYPNADK